MQQELKLSPFKLLFEVYDVEEKIIHFEGLQ